MECVVDFRLISLCNTSYKVISKLIVNRIKTLLGECISLSQFSFIPSRNIMDNILLAKELAHSIAHNKSKIKPMASKVDLSKAYGSLEWAFIHGTLDFFSNTEALMNCITTCTMQILWRGQPGPSFQPSRGLRQGDPLSPYIFALCMERLSQLTHYEVVHNGWIPFKICNFQASIFSMRVMLWFLELQPSITWIQ